MAYISRALRQLVTERAGRLCEYCHTAQAIVIEMEIDHIVPEVVGGVTEAGNLCLACISCNTLHVQTRLPDGYRLADRGRSASIPPTSAAVARAFPVG
jgi:5-methylcytosine-specific restriction endonuclease McrA